MQKTSSGVKVETPNGPSKDDLFDDLRLRILRGQLAPGQWLVERELSERYRVSRTPVREQLRRLAELGIVQMEPSRGYQVKRLSVEEVVDIFNAREAVEGEGARLACRTESLDFSRRIKELRARLEKLDIRRNTEQGIALGKRVHDLIVKTANNRYLSEFYHKLTHLAALTRNMTKSLPSIEECSRHSHLRILDALESRDGELSERLMRLHIRSTCEALVASLLNFSGRPHEPGETAAE